MMIVIFNVVSETDPFTNEVISRGVMFYITDGTDEYMYNVGGQPLEGDMQDILEAQEAALFTLAAANGLLPTEIELAEKDFLLYLINNPNAKLIFTSAAATLESEINAFVDRIIPSATNADKTRLKRLLGVGALRDRIDVAGE